VFRNQLTLLAGKNIPTSLLGLAAAQTHQSYYHTRGARTCAASCCEFDVASSQTGGSTIHERLMQAASAAAGAALAQAARAGLRRSNFIGGRWVAATRSLDVRDPTSGEVLHAGPAATAAEASDAVLAAHAALRHGPWAVTTDGDRAGLLHRVAEVLARRREDIAA
jgi:hypothetical protein